MDWRDVGAIAGKAAPIIGTILGGPVGAGVGVVGSLLASTFGSENTPDAIHAAIAADPQAAVKLAQIEADNRTQLAQIASQQAIAEIQAEAAKIQSVNLTMQAEAKSEHWLQWSWRPVCGLTFCVLTIAVYFGLPLAKLPVPPIPETVWMAFLAILGVASWGRAMWGSKSAPAK